MARIATLVDRLPAIHYMAAALGGRVRVAEYAVYGSDRLAAAVLTALRDRTGCLMRNHGTLVYADTLAEAYDNTAQLEWMCRVWLLAGSAGGGAPSTLSDQELARAAAKLRGYGQGGGAPDCAPGGGLAEGRGPGREQRRTRTGAGARTAAGAARTPPGEPRARPRRVRPRPSPG